MCGKERVVLEDRVDVALVGWSPAGHVLAAQPDRPPRWAGRTRRSCAGWSSCPSPTGRAWRRTRRRPRPGRCDRRPPRRRTACARLRATPQGDRGAPQSAPARSGFGPGMSREYKQRLPVSPVRATSCGAGATRLARGLHRWHHFTTPLVKGCNDRVPSGRNVGRRDVSAAGAAGAPGPAAGRARAGRSVAHGQGGRGALAINPNTVLKAYRDLEREGLVPGPAGARARSSCGRCRAPIPAPRRGSGRRWQVAALSPRGRPRRSGRHRGDLSHRDPQLPRRARRMNSGSTRAAWASGTAAGGRSRTARWSCPTGRVVGLVGPNGAGKTTLLHLAVGLVTPTAGTIEVLGGRPADGPEQLARVGFVGQETPVYPTFTVSQHLRMGAWLNPSWDAAMADARIDRLQLDRRQRAGSLSGGQRAQLALTLAIAKRPQLLILDEPVASLDPLARREFLQSLMEVVADQGVSVRLSSHLVADLERVCDHLIVLAASHVQLTGEVAELLATHHRLTGPRRDPASLPASQRVVEQSHTDRQTTLLVRTDEPIIDPSVDGHAGQLDDLVIAYMSQARDGEPAARSRAGGRTVIRLRLASVAHADRGGRRGPSRHGRAAGLLRPAPDPPLPDDGGQLRGAQRLLARRSGVPSPRQDPRAPARLPGGGRARSWSASSGARRWWPASWSRARPGWPGHRASRAGAGWP